MSSQLVGNEPPTNPASTHNLTQSTQVPPFQNVESVKDALLLILKDTEWPRRSTETAHELIRIIENASGLKGIPKDGHPFKAEHRDSLERFIAVQLKLREASNTYGAEKKRFRTWTRTSARKYWSLVETISTTHWRPFPTAGILKKLKSLQVLKSFGSQPGENNQLKGDVLSAGSVGVKVDHPIGSAPQVVTSHSTISVPSSSSRDDPTVPEDQFNGASARRESFGGLKTTFNVVESIAGTIPVIGTFVGAAAKIGATIVDIVQQMGNNEEAAESLTSHASQLSKMLKRFENKSVEQNKDSLTSLISNLQRELQHVEQKVVKLNSSSVLNKAFSSSDRADALKGYQDTISTALEQIQLLTTLNTTALVTELYDKGIREEQQRLLDRLGDAGYGARGHAIEDVICLQGTRVEILECINLWIRSTSASDRVLCIRGMAGRGKSTIASTVAHCWKYQAASAIFHFRRGQNEMDNRLACTLARQLGSSTLVPEVKEAILRSIRENQDIGQARLREQFQTLFVRSLRGLQDTSVPILLVIDALDEFQDVEYAVNFVKLIDQCLPSLPANIKFLLTTCPEAPLIRALELRRWHAVDLDGVAGVDNDIAAFLQHGFSRIRNEYDLQEDWPTQGNMGTILKMSQGLFQWACTAIEYMMEGSPEDRLQELLALPSICHGMDNLYLRIFSKAFEKANNNPARGEVFLRLLGTLIVAPYPISLEIFAYLLADHPTLRNKPCENIVRNLRLEVLVDLGSLIRIPHSSSDPIQLLHTSIRDFLSDLERCRRKPYSVDIASHHHNLASKCLELMERDLKTNICGLSDLSKANSEMEIQDLVQLSVPKGLQYCCRSWSIHLTQATTELILNDWGAIHAILKHLSEENLLNWLEVFSLIGETQIALAIAQQMHLWLQAHLDVSDFSLTSMWGDLQRFITVFYEPISFGALHIYASTLPFCPLNTLLWKYYSRHATTKVLNGLRSMTWPPSICSKRIGSLVESVAFSPDGKLLASGSHDGTICLWDADTGAPIGEPLIGHDEWVSSVCFSPNGKLLASGSHDKTIWLWDIKTGKPLGEPFRGHEDWVLSVCFSPNGTLLASGSDDMTIRLWDIETGALIGEPWRGHDGSVSSISFSPNGKLLASGSHDRTIQLWNTEIGVAIGEPLRGHTKWVESVCFSPDGKVLASGSDDGTIRLWEVETGEAIGEPLKGHDKPVESVCFSPNGKLLASGSWDRTIRLWDRETGAQMGEPLTGHNHLVESVCFSPDGRFLASGSYDKRIQLWNAETGAAIADPKGHDDSVLSICPSFNERDLASGSVQLWDAETRAPTGQPLKGHNSEVQAACFSPDGNLLASGSLDSTIRLWDAKTGRAIGDHLRGHDISVESVCFSMDGTLLVSGSEDMTVRLWDVRTGMAFGEPLRGHIDSVHDNIFDIHHVCFSPNGKLIASHAHGKTIWWDSKIRVVVNDIPEHNATLPPSDGDPLPILDLPLNHFLRSSTSTPIGSEGQWVTFMSKRLFWFPHQYWSDTTKILLSHGSLVFAVDKWVFFSDVSAALSL